MSSSLIQKADLWVTKVLSYPGIDEKSLAQKKIYWKASLAVTSMMICLTVAYHLIFPQLRILIYYGLSLSLIFLQGVIYPIIFHRTGVWLIFIDQSLVAIATFICILLLGGIPYSGGLVFVGLALVFFSLNFRKRWHSIYIFVIYVITIIIAGVLHPQLKVPPEMTPAVNISLFVINLLWITGFAMVFVMNFISQRVMLEQMETKRLKELDEAKTLLYTNITHEFRTPLTIIMGMTDLMRNDPAKWLDEGTEKIDRYAGILLNLVNQMLDLAKLEAGGMKVRKIRSDVDLYLRYIVDLFQSVAICRKITLRFTPSGRHPVIDYDPDKLMDIVSNLISNALKFTQPGGRTEVSSVLTEGGNFEIRVSDNGPGILEENLPYIFDRFYRIDVSGTNSYPGSGLGLALTRELAKLLNGTVTVESIYGEGTEFTVSLPVTVEAPLQEGPGANDIKGKLSNYFFHPPVKNPSEKVHTDSRSEKPVLLLVDDNDDVVQYITVLLWKDYDLIVAGDGKQGLDMAMEHVPDIILSDIMMPVMDGIEMLGKVKSDFRTSHIPVVMLTARADIASRLEGIGLGADAYLAKPFNSEELKIQLRSLINQRKRLQERYAEIGHVVFSDDKDFHIEDTFMKKIMGIMSANIGDETFDIHRLCDEMVMSRTQLYRKFRSLTDRTITEYLRSLRLRRAKELLAGSEITVAEAAYKTGFRSASHFSRVFTREFGVNPCQIIREKSSN